MAGKEIDHDLPARIAGYACLWQVMYTKDPKIRRKLRDHLRALVTEAIEDARGGNKMQAGKLELALSINPEYYHGSFWSWDEYLGRPLGLKSCQRLGMKVCKELDFSLEEARRILGITRPQFDMRRL